MGQQGSSRRRHGSGDSCSSDDNAGTAGAGEKRARSNTGGRRSRRQPVGSLPQPGCYAEVPLHSASAVGASSAVSAEAVEQRARSSPTSQHSPYAKLPTMFTWSRGGNKVSISGSFNQWKSRIPMVRSHDKFYAIIELPEGTHQFKYLVDDEWRHDENQLHIPNEVGSLNNVVTVKKSDFEVFEALADDSVGTSEPQTKADGSPPGSYSQFMPQRKPPEHANLISPPVLPPHLLEVILNKDVPANVEPTLLPEPNHVMLNHLYALSIKDGVMVLSTTDRYRKKFVTTLLYKPINS